MTHIGLFEGIGGFSYAAKQMGWQTKAWCEWNEFGQQVLRYHYPEAEGYGDITKTDFTKYANTIDILTGGFPCQPYSLAGKRKGKDDERHLWPEMLRAIREIRPRWVVGENVFGLINWSNGLVFHEVQTDLEAEGYEVWPYVLPACAVNAPHRRDRVWFVAYGNTKQREWQKGRFQPEPVNGSEEFNTYTHSNGCEWCNSQHEKHTGKRGQHAQYDIEPLNAKNRNGDGCTCNYRQGEPNERQQWHTSTGNNERVPTNDAETRDSTNCTCSRSKGQLQQQQGQEQFRGCHCQPNATDTNSRRQPCEEHGQAKSGWATETSLRSNWKNFPTQSPICDGNDGLSTRLHGITFSKWRNESIKAAGNAIVPQVALQIFKAIEEFEHLTTMQTFA